MENALCKLFMEFILLIDIIKCWLNNPLQVITVAPALHSLIIRNREDAARILEFLFHKPGDLRKLTLEQCCLGEDDTGLLRNFVDLYPDLEALSFVRCKQLTPAIYGLIPRLKKLSELNLSAWKVHYMYVKVSETHICIHEACRRTRLEIHILYLGKKEI